MSLREKLLAAQNIPEKRKGSTNKIPRQSVVWTPEQEEFLHCDEENIFLTALAGTGKTTTLLEYARRRPHQKWNFLAFNKKVVEEVKNKAPSNIKIKTAHSLAFEKFGLPLAHKLSDRFLLKDFENLLPGSSSSDLKKIINFFVAYLHSPQDIEEFCQARGQNFENQEEILRKIWERCLSPQHSFVITHDVYFKRFVQSGFSWEGRYMVDEAQDWSGAFLHAVSKKPQASVICGDPYQNLYRWRHAIGLDVSMPHQFWLTQSFRQGKELTAVANRLLDKMKCPVRLIPKDLQGGITKEENYKAFDVVLAYDNKTLKSFPPPALTIHASKGCEFERVFVADHNFPVFLPYEEKLSIMYVAVTRAQKALRLPFSWEELMDIPNASQNKQDLSCFDPDSSFFYEEF